MLVRVYQRRGTAVEWAVANPILAEGEIALETDTNSFKIGNGLDSWNNLSYASGQSAYSAAVANGFTGTEAEWIDSLSAYGRALENGFVGTEEDWLLSLVGPQGPQGVQGETGPIGPTGATGIEWQGAWDSETDYVDNNAVFYNGASWFASGDPAVGEEPSENSTHWFPLALQGATGPQGPQGIQGETGPQGIQGETGPQGPQGIQGETGAGLAILGYLDNISELPVSANVGEGYLVGANLYIWNGSSWENVGPIGATAIISSMPPSGSITPGSFWYDPESGKIYVYFSDIDSSQWVEI